MGLIYSSESQNIMLSEPDKLFIDKRKNVVITNHENIFFLQCTNNVQHPLDDAMAAILC